MHFDSIEYLRYGSPRQRAAYDALTAHGIMDKLRDYLPILGVSLDDDWRRDAWTGALVYVKKKPRNGENRGFLTNQL